MKCNGRRQYLTDIEFAYDAGLTIAGFHVQGALGGGAWNAANDASHNNLIERKSEA